MAHFPPAHRCGGAQLPSTDERRALLPLGAERGKEDADPEVERRCKGRGRGRSDFRLECGFQMPQNGVWWRPDRICRGELLRVLRGRSNSQLPARGAARSGPASGFPFQARPRGGQRGRPSAAAWTRWAPPLPPAAWTRRGTGTRCVRHMRTPLLGATQHCPGTD